MTMIGIDIGGTSVKAAARAGDGGADWGLGRSDRYDRPSASRLVVAIGEAVAGATGALVPTIDAGSSTPGRVAVGLCLPGVYDRATGRVVRSVNVPGLEGVDVAGLVGEALRRVGIALRSADRPAVMSDARAAAEDWWSRHADEHPAAPADAARGPIGGATSVPRLLAISIGTGVGACVLDGGAPLEVSGHSPGHLGQIDVSIEADPADRPIGPDGGRGGLEAYIGARAMVARLGERVDEWPDRLRVDPTPLLALARAIRIAHAVYRPGTVVLLGGVGLAIRPCFDALDRMIREGLTSLARDGWALRFADDEHHAARGAASGAARPASLRPASDGD